MQLNEKGEKGARVSSLLLHVTDTREERVFLLSWLKNSSKKVKKKHKRRNASSFKLIR